MKSKAKILGHPIHQVLGVFLLGLLGIAVVFDIIHLCSGTATTAVVAYWLMAAGIIGGLVAAPFGWIDWFAIPSRTRDKAVYLMHGITSVIVVVLFIISWSLRSSSGETPGAAAYVLSFVGLGIPTVGGWLGGLLVGRLGVGVYDGAHLNAPNTLSGRPTSMDAERTGGGAPLCEGTEVTTRREEPSHAGRTRF